MAPGESTQARQRAYYQGRGAERRRMLCALIVVFALLFLAAGIRMSVQGLSGGAGDSAEAMKLASSPPRQVAPSLSADGPDVRVLESLPGFMEPAEVDDPLWESHAQKQKETDYFPARLGASQFEADPFVQRLNRAGSARLDAVFLLLDSTSDRRLMRAFSENEQQLSGLFSAVFPDCRIGVVLLGDRQRPFVAFNPSEDPRSAFRCVAMSLKRVRKGEVPAEVDLGEAVVRALRLTRRPGAARRLFIMAAGPARLSRAVSAERRLDNLRFLEGGGGALVVWAGAGSETSDGPPALPGVELRLLRDKKESAHAVMTLLLGDQWEKQVAGMCRNSLARPLVKAGAYRPPALLTASDQKQTARLREDVIFAQELDRRGYRRLSQVQFERILKSNPPAEAAHFVRLKSAEHFYREGRLDEAAALLEQAGAKTNAGMIADSSRFLLAELYMQQEKWGEAQDVLGRYLLSGTWKSVPHYAYALYALGYSYCREGRFELAQAPLLQLTENFDYLSLHSRARLLLAYCHSRATGGREEDRIENCRRAGRIYQEELRLHPKTADPGALLEYVRVVRKSLGSSAVQPVVEQILDSECSIDLRRSVTVEWVVALAEEGRYAEAMQALARGFGEMNWGDVPSRLADVGARLADEDSSELNRVAVQPLHRLCVAEYLLASGDATGALEELKRELAEFPGGVGRARALFVKGVCCQQLGRLEDALAAFRSVVDNHPQSSVAFSARLRLVVVLGRLGLKSAVRRQLEQFGATETEDSRVRLLSAWASLVEDDVEAAEDLLRSLSDGGGRDGLEHASGFWLAYCRYVSSDWAGAEACFLDVSRSASAPLSDWAALGAAECRLRQGDAVEALRALQPLVLEGPESVRWRARAFEILALLRSGQGEPALSKARSVLDSDASLDWSVLHDVAASVEWVYGNTSAAKAAFRRLAEDAPGRLPFETRLWLLSSPGLVDAATARGLLGGTQDAAGTELTRIQSLRLRLALARYLLEPGQEGDFGGVLDPCLQDDSPAWATGEAKVLLARRALHDGHFQRAVEMLRGLRGVFGDVRDAWVELHLAEGLMGLSRTRVARRRLEGILCVYDLSRPSEVVARAHLLLATALERDGSMEEAVRHAALAVERSRGLGYTCELEVQRAVRRFGLEENNGWDFP